MGTSCTSAAPCALTEALTQAGTGDTVALTAGTFALTDSVGVGAFTLRALTPATRPVLQLTGGAYVYTNSPAAVVSDLRIDASGLGATTWALRLQPGTAQRVEVVSDGAASANGVLVSGGGTLADSTVWAKSPTGSALNSGDLAATFRNVTAVATGTDSTGFFTSDSYVTADASVTVQNTILRGTRRDLEFYSSNPAKTITVTVAHGNYATTGASSGTHGHLTDVGGRQTAEPVFVDAAVGNLRQAATSPTRDAGASVAGLSATALDGQARTQGSAPDIGADEFAVATSTLTPGAVKRKRNGTARLALTASAAGTVTLTGPRIKPVTVTFGAAGATTVKIKPTKAGKRKLARKGKVRTTLAITWTPASGYGISPAPVAIALKKVRRR